MRPEKFRKADAAKHSCERRKGKRLLCSDLVRISWTDGPGRFQEIAVLENLSIAGVGVFMGVPIPNHAGIQMESNGITLRGAVKRCCFRENGYLIGIELDDDSKWAQQPGNGFVPAHLLDLSRLQFD